MNTTTIRQSRLKKEIKTELIAEIKNIQTLWDLMIVDLANITGMKYRSLQKGLINPEHIDVPTLRNVILKTKLFINDNLNMLDDLDITDNMMEAINVENKSMHY